MVDKYTYELILEKMRQWMLCFDDPDEPIIGLAGDEQPMARSPRQMVNEVADRTDSGRRFVEQWVKLVGVERLLQSPLF